MPSLAYTLAGRGVVLLISKVTFPSHPGSKGVTLIMIPQRAYVLFPRQIVMTFSGIRKYSTVRARAKELGGNNTATSFNRDKAVGVKILRINYSGIDICKNFEFVCNSNIVSIRRNPIRNNSLSDLRWFERFDHSMRWFKWFFSDPFVWFDSHGPLIVRPWACWQPKICVTF